MDYLIREMEKLNIPAVVDVHLAGFQGFFLSFLGPTFLRELYTSLLDDQFGICLVAMDKNEVVGFVVGTTRSPRVYSKLLRQRQICFFLALIPTVLRQPSIISRLWRRVFDPHGQPRSNLNRGRLMSIGVLHPKQGWGVGQLLVSGFL